MGNATMDPVYLDYAATTPMREEVCHAMGAYLSESFGNPSSIHRWGRIAKDALEQARDDVARAIGARSSEISFVRGGTESDNLAILGWCRAQKLEGRMPSILVTAVEHQAVLEAAMNAEKVGEAFVTKVGLSAEGGLDLDGIRESTRRGEAIVSVMWVNNEMGLTLPVHDVAEALESTGGVLHSDAAQAIGKVPVDVSESSIDLLSATGHKIYGPKGIGILFVRDGISIAPLIHGGGQEKGLRPGTEDVAGAVGFAAAIKLAIEEQEPEAIRLKSLRDHMELALSTQLVGVRINGGKWARAPHILSVGVHGIEDGNELLMALDLEGVAVSSGSACSSGGRKASHVMAALYGPDDPHATVRFSFGRRTTSQDLDRAIAATIAVVERLRRAK